MNNVKKILLKLVLFVLPLVIGFTYIEYNLRTQYLVSSYATKKYYLQKELNNIETLVLGSSQNFNGIDVSCFAHYAFNMANVSQTLHYDKRLCLQYLPQLPKLKTVIIGISYFSFFYQLCDVSENWREDFYKIYYDIDGCKQQQTSLLYINVFEPQHAMALAFKHFKDDNAVAILPNGFQPKYIQKEISDSIGLQRVNVHNSEYFTARRKEIENDVEDFIQQLTQKNIQVVFVTTPVFSTYSKFCNNNIVIQNTNFINHLCKKYKSVYLNYFTDARFLHSDFEDNDHLKSNGAKKLSTIINDTLQKLKINI